MQCHVAMLVCFIYRGLSMYKQCWVNCTFHTQLKHASHLFKARFSGKAGSCFLKVRAASLIRLRKVTQVIVIAQVPGIYIV